MADPVTMMAAGAALGAVTNKDDPMKGAMLGAALGGGAGYLGGAGLAAQSGAGAAEGALGNALIDTSLGSAYQAAGVGAPTSFPVAPGAVGEITVLPDWVYNTMSPGEAVDAMGGGINHEAIARASLGADIPGVSAVAGASPYTAMRMNPLLAMSAMNMLNPPQQPIPTGSVKRGNPQLVQQDAIMSLLAPKRVEKRKISLL